MAVIFAFGVSDSMLLGSEGQMILRDQVSPEQAKEIISFAKAQGNLVVGLNPSHAASIDVMQKRFGIEVQIPERAPKIELQHGNVLVLMGISGLPRLEGRHEYTQEEVNNAKFTFSTWRIYKRPQFFGLMCQGMMDGGGNSEVSPYVPLPEMAVIPEAFLWDQDREICIHFPD